MAKSFVIKCQYTYMLGQSLLYVLFYWWCCINCLLQFHVLQMKHVEYVSNINVCWLIGPFLIQWKWHIMLLRKLTRNCLVPLLFSELLSSNCKSECNKCSLYTSTRVLHWFFMFENSGIKIWNFLSFLWESVITWIKKFIPPD